MTEIFFIFPAPHIHEKHFKHLVGIQVDSIRCQLLVMVAFDGPTGITGRELFCISEMFSLTKW